MKNFILTSCGLSILTNYLRDNYKIFPNVVYKYANLKKEEIDKDFLEKTQNAISKLKQSIIDFDENKLKKISAELNALVTFYNNNFKKDDYHLLLHTDTYLGDEVASILEYFLQSKGLIAEKFCATDLNTNSLEEFQLSLTEIIKNLSERIEGFKNSGYEIIFNLTGGFKGSNSFLQTMASLYADKSFYIFETGKELLIIPRLPIKIDEEFFSKNIKIFRANEIGLDIKQEIFKKLPKSVVNQIGNEYFISPWGEIVWQKYKNEIYRKKLIMPISDNIIYSTEFKKDFEKLNSFEKFQLNKSVDKLEKYITDNINPSSLRYHELKGEVAKQYSYEFYPFDGNDSRRVFCNENDNKIILGKIDSHLK